jgi:hypothetical protein
MDRGCEVNAARNRNDPPEVNMRDDEVPPWLESANPWRADEPDEDRWRGEVHYEDWPEELAGPEYRLFKRREEDGGEE